MHNNFQIENTATEIPWENGLSVGRIDFQKVLCIFTVCLSL